MNRLTKKALSLFVMFGFDPIKTSTSIKHLPSYFKDLNVIKNQKKTSQSEFKFGKAYPCLDDRSSDSGSANSQYFYQDLIVAKRVFDNNPVKHVDVGSRIDGFVSHVASYRFIEVFDIRPLSNTIPNVSFIQADMMSQINENLYNYCDSLSCLHALEHFGLGRYGDPVNYDGYISGFNNMTKLLNRGGKFYLSVPIGSQRIEFNAHRVFSINTLLGLFEGKFILDRFSYIDDFNKLHDNITISDINIQNNFGCNYGCGVFELTKI